MYTKSIQNLIELFSKFPGIGPRQASRFVFYTLNTAGFANELKLALVELEKISFCSLCFRTMEKAEGIFCKFCRDAKRDHTFIAVVEKESDMQNLEKSGEYHGLYHVLNGFISPLDSNSPKKLHLRELHGRVQKTLEETNFCEVVFATNPTTEGDMTALYIDRVLAPLQKQYPKLKMSRLGRGLSLGSELEHVDEVTLKNAFLNRK